MSSLLHTLAQQKHSQAAYAPSDPVGKIFSIFENSHSLLHSGQAERVFSLQVEGD